MKKFKYQCGCSFDLVDDDSNKIIFKPDINQINLDCTKTWALISEGNTKGCFQLESRLGRSMSKKLKPENIEQLSALISIMRPGCLEAVRNGKSVSSHYIDRKNGNESIDYFHPALSDILESTYGEMIYQEQTMEIAKSIAGFNLQDADILRKAIGKKNPQQMSKVKKSFLSGCESQKIVTLEQAEQIFGWIEKSQRYLFNKSHSVSYAINAYLSAYAKAHFPRVFFASYLRYAKDKMDPQSEIKELVQNANEMNIKVNIPDIRLLNEHFTINQKHIYFGLTDIKGVGKSVYEKIIKLANGIDFFAKDWEHLAIELLLCINSTAAKALIKSGAFDFVKKSRSCMLFEYEILKQLTDKEVLQIKNHDGTLTDRLKFLVQHGKINRNRAKIIQDLIYTHDHPPYSLQDSPEYISDCESDLLGCAITMSRIEVYDTSIANTSCKEFKQGKNSNDLIIAGEIDFVNVTKTKTGKNKGKDMAFVSLTDTTANIDSVIFFPEQYQEFKNALFDQNVIIIKGNRSKGAGDSFIVEKCYIAKT